MRPEQVFTQAVTFFLLSLLPWIVWLGPSWGQSVQYGWVVAGGIWWFGAFVLFEQEASDEDSGRNVSRIR